MSLLRVKRLRFRLRAILLGVALASIVLCTYVCVSRPLRVRGESVRTLAAKGCLIEFDSRYGSVLEKLFGSLIDKDGVRDVDKIRCGGKYPRHELLMFDVIRGDIGDEDMHLFARLPEIRSLDLSSTELTDEGLSSLESLECLEDLRLDFTDITDCGVESLVRLKNLKHLSLHGTNVTPSGVAHLKVSLPSCKIIRHDRSIINWRLKRSADFSGTAGMTIKLEPRPRGKLEEALSSRGLLD